MTKTTNILLKNKKVLSLVQFVAKQSKFLLIGAGIITAIALTVSASYILPLKNKANVSENKQSSVIKDNNATASITPTKTITPVLTLASTPKITKSKITPTTTAKVTVTPSPTSNPVNNARTPNPPQIGISYPSEGQTVNQNGGSFCAIDAPIGGDTSGAQSKKNVNGAGWDQYVPISSLCFEPKEGANTFLVQYKNQYGDESPVYTRNFSFHRVQDITLSITGQVFEDKDCSIGRGSGENGIGGVTVNLFQSPNNNLYETVTTDSNGNYNFSKSVPESVVLLLNPVAVAPGNYKSNPKHNGYYANLSSGNRTVSIDIPLVPNENVSSCQ